MSKNIIVTGGSGMAGKWVVKDLLDHGHRVMNLDRTVLKDSAARTVITDLTDAGQVFNALCSTTVRHEFSPRSSLSRSMQSFTLRQSRGS